MRRAPLGYADMQNAMERQIRSSIAFVLHILTEFSYSVKHAGTVRESLFIFRIAAADIHLDLPKLRICRRLAAFDKAVQPEAPPDARLRADTRAIIEIGRGAHLQDAWIILVPVRAQAYCESGRQPSPVIFV